MREHSPLHSPPMKLLYSSLLYSRPCTACNHIYKCRCTKKGLLRSSCTLKAMYSALCVPALACTVRYCCHSEVPANVAAPAAAAVVPPAGARLRLPIVLARNREADVRYASGRSSGAARPLDKRISWILLISSLSLRRCSIVTWKPAEDRKSRSNNSGLAPLAPSALRLPEATRCRTRATMDIPWIARMRSTASRGQGVAQTHGIASSGGGWWGR